MTNNGRPMIDQLSIISRPFWTSDVDRSLLPTIIGFIRSGHQPYKIVFCLGLVAGIEKSDHDRPAMNKSDRPTLGSKMGDQWSTIGRPKSTDHWSTQVDRPFSILLHLTRRVALYHLISTRLQSSSSLSS